MLQEMDLARTQAQPKFGVANIVSPHYAKEVATKVKNNQGKHSCGTLEAKTFAVSFRAVNPDLHSFYEFGLSEIEVKKTPLSKLLEAHSLVTLRAQRLRP